MLARDYGGGVTGLVNGLLACVKGPYMDAGSYGCGGYEPLVPNRPCAEQHGLDDGISNIADFAGHDSIQHTSHSYMLMIGDLMWFSPFLLS